MRKNKEDHVVRRYPRMNENCSMLVRTLNGHRVEGLVKTRLRLREAVAGAEVQGASGLIRFDEHGDRLQGVALSAVERAPDGRPIALARGWLGER